jgi:hypothetical protein
MFGGLWKVGDKIFMNGVEYTIKSISPFGDLGLEESTTKYKATEEEMQRFKKPPREEEAPEAGPVLASDGWRK